MSDTIFLASLISSVRVETLAVKDAKDAQDSLSNAIAVLTTFYKESGEIPKEPWEFIQKPVNLGKKPSTWDAGYTGVADPDKKEGGIISILEGVLADFSKMQTSNTKLLFECVNK
jgi:hypothetical protein